MPTPVAQHRVRFRLPRVVEHFVGRDAELYALDNVLGKGHQAVITQSLTGLGGVGKTQLAAAYVARHTDDYDIVAWIRAEDGGIADLAELAVDLDGALEGLGPPERASGVLRFLEITERSWFLVLDNVATPEQLSACCPSAGSGRVLVTSRHQSFDDFGPVFRVGVLDTQVAEEYLMERARRSDDRTGARRVAAALGCLPLALSHAGSYCSAGTGFGDYLELLEGLPAAEVFDTNPEAFYERTVASTWEASIHKAGAKAPLAVPMLAMAAYLAPDAMPRSLFAVLVEGDGPRQRKALADACGALHRFSLAETSEESISVHRLVQKVVRDGAGARSDTTGPLAALEALSKAFPRDPELSADWPVCEQLLAHVLALGDRWALEWGEGEAIVGILNLACAYLVELGDAGRAVPSAGVVVSVADILLGPGHPHTLKARANLAWSYLFAGRTAEAIVILEAAVADSERILGPDHPDTLKARASLAWSYRFAGRTAEAISIFEAVVADRERILGPEDPDTLIARDFLGRTYWSAGRTAEAIPMQEGVLADAERILGPEHPHTLAAWGNLAESYLVAGRTGEATAIFEAVVADSERILGPDHPDTLWARESLGHTYSSDGRTAEATAIFEAVVADRERILPDHTDTLWARANLAHCYLVAGRTAEAISIFEAVVADRERILGPGHPNTLRARASLAGSYGSAGRTAEAIATEEAVVADFERTLPDHPDTLWARAGLAASYRSVGRAAEAISMEEAVVADFERILGPDPGNALRARAHLAAFYRSVGRAAEAIRIEEVVVAQYERILGPAHPDTLSVRANLGHSLAGRPAEAAVANRERIRDPAHRETFMPRANLAASLGHDEIKDPESSPP
jgi:tetratricopeptide (TPR) repeat protein